MLDAARVTQGTLVRMSDPAQATIRTNIGAAIAGLAVVLPFAVLEVSTYSGAPRTAYPALGFAFMWLLAAGFARVLVAAVRTVRAMRSGRMDLVRSASLAAMIVCLGFMGWTWLSGVIDQWPCFLGASGC